jgi:D-alanyl-D-alanine carboxypeptidase
MAAFDKYLRGTLELATREAERDCSATVEAQHVLLAMAHQPETDLGQFLDRVGLTPNAIRSALDRELQHSLSAVGISLEAPEKLRMGTAPSGQLGTSVRHALERGLGAIRREPRPADVLLGILQAEVGSVPRALALAGFDRVDLIGRLQQALLA